MKKLIVAFGLFVVFAGTASALCTSLVVPPRAFGSCGTGWVINCTQTGVPAPGRTNYAGEVYLEHVCPQSRDVYPYAQWSQIDNTTLRDYWLGRWIIEADRCSRGCP